MTATLAGGPWTRRRAAELPFRWLSTPPGDLLPAARTAELAAAFPTDAYTRLDTGDRPTGKSYRNYSRVLAAPGRDTDRALPPAWRALLEQLLAPGYRRAVASVLGQATAGGLEVRLVRHAPGDWLGPHTDRPDKLFSHILYFNPGWRAEWGGCLQILRGPDPADVEAEVVPRLGASALLVPSADSWHQVSPVRGQSAPERRSLLVHGLR